MSPSSSRRVGGGGNPNRWLLLAGAGLLALGFVLRLMMDIGRTGATTPEDAAAGTDSASLAATPRASTGSDADSGEAAVDVDTVMPGPHTATAIPPAAPTPVAAAPVPPPPSPAIAGAYTVQLGVFAAAANARRVVDRARALGYSAESAPVGGAGKYRVRVGGFATSSDAQVAADSLGRGLGVQAVVLRR